MAELPLKVVPAFSRRLKSEGNHEQDENGRNPARIQGGGGGREREKRHVVPRYLKVNSKEHRALGVLNV